ncbi:MAG: dihydropyrimidinase [Deltaproteobacteria bacterium]|nr:dihydropyrimidinase [Deltaproteobacteria bacterium]
MARVIISGGRVVCGTGTFKADLLVENEKIAAIGKAKGFGRADRTIDATGMIVLPGLIDVHVHFLEPFMGTVSLQDFFTGTRAAAFGGVTTVIDFAHQEKGKSLAEAIERRREQADGHVVIDYGLHVGVTDPTRATLSEVENVIKSGVPSFKVYTIYRDEGLMLDDGALLALLQETRRHGGLVIVHAENAFVTEYRQRVYLDHGKTSAPYHALSRPNVVEEEAIQRVALLARFAEAPFYIVHLSTREGVGIIGRNKAEGFPAFAETCTHYLCLTDEVYDRADGIHYIISPPLRKKQDMTALWEGLADGSLSVVSSDDISFSNEAKLMGKDSFDRVPNGMPGVELRLPVLFSEGFRKGRITLERLVEITSTNPSRLFGLFPQKGVIQVGSDADLVILDPTKEVVLGKDTLHMVADFCCLEGMKVRGYPVVTMSRGKVIVEDGRFLGKEGDGRFLERKIDLKGLRNLR